MTRGTPTLLRTYILLLYQNIKDPSQKLLSFSEPATRTLILAKLSSNIHNRSNSSLVLYSTDTLQSGPYADL